MSALFAAVDLLALFYVLFLPSYVLGRALAPQQHSLPRFLLGVVTVLLALPMCATVSASLLNVPVNSVLLYSLASLLIVLGGLVQLRRYRRRTRTLEA